MSPARQLRRPLARIETARGDIVRFHDTKAQATAMRPALLRALKSGGYRVVHVVPGARRGSAMMALPTPAWLRCHSQH